jgi:hypothetical protein
MSVISKFLIVAGIILVIVGLALPWLQKIGLGHLPGDIIIKKKNFSFYFPIVTCIVISAVLSLIFWLFRR